MKKSYFTDKQARNLFSRVNDAFKYVRIKTHVMFVNSENATLMHGIVVAKWGGTDRRLVVVDDGGNTHYLRDLTAVSVFSRNAGGYVPFPAFRDVWYV